MKKQLCFVAFMVFLFLSVAGCSNGPSMTSSFGRTKSQTNESSAYFSSSPQSSSHLPSSQPSSTPLESSSRPQTSESEDKMLALFQERVSAVDLSGVFCHDLKAGVLSSDNGLGIFSAGLLLLGEEKLEETYLYAPWDSGRLGIIEQYPYTPAAIMDTVLQEYFVFSPEELHRMIPSYEPTIDGYWAPMGLGGSPPFAQVLSYEMQENHATLYCISYSAPPPDDLGTPATIEMAYSEPYGWRFVSCQIDK